MNKTAFLVELQRKTGLTESECVIANNIIENTSLFGKKNKIRMIDGFISELNVSEERAEEIYEAFIHIMSSRIKWKLIHPFKKYDNKKEDR